MQEIGLFVNTVTTTSGFYILCGLLIAVLIYIKKREEAIIFATAMVLTTSCVVVLKLLFAVPRPEEALLVLTSYAFPSGHATSAMFLAVTLTWLYLKRSPTNLYLKVFTITILFNAALFVGYSRLIIGVHTPLQVLAGFAIGALIPLLCIYFLSGKTKLFLGLRKIFPSL